MPLEVKRIAILIGVSLLGAAHAATLLGDSARSVLDADRLQNVEGGDAPPASPEEAEFESYQRKFNRKYEHGSEEYWHRRHLFEKRSAEVKAHNARRDRLWQAVAGRFADFTEEERASLRGYRHKPSPQSGGSELPPEVAAERELLRPILGNATMPAEFNWLHLKVAKHVPDQLQCGSCWAVAAKSVLDAHHEIYVGSVRNFSAQQIISCAPDPRHCGGKGKCEGSTVELAFDWVLHKGCATQEEVPYQGQDLTEKIAKCSASSSLSGEHGLFGEPSDHGPNMLAGSFFGMIGYKKLVQNQESDLIQHLYQHGPVATSACADTWFEYDRGIIDSCNSSCIVDHAITLYGYGQAKVKERQSDDDEFQVLAADSITTPTELKKYWLVRNSWGQSWGEQGFLRLLRFDHEGAHCGEDTDNAEGTGCDGDPQTVKVCGMCGFLWDSVVPHFHRPPAHQLLQTDVSAQANVKLLRSESVPDQIS